MMVALALVLSNHTSADRAQLQPNTDTYKPCFDFVVGKRVPMFLRASLKAVDQMNVLQQELNLKVSW